jgi:hypothetical protein
MAFLKTLKNKVIDDYDKENESKVHLKTIFIRILVPILLRIYLQIRILFFSSNQIYYLYFKVIHIIWRIEHIIK